MATALQERQTEFEKISEGSLEEINTDEAQTTILALRENIVDLKQEVAFIMPYTDKLGWLPNGLGDLALAAPQLLDMADVGTEMAVELSEGLLPAVTLLQDGDSSQPLIPALTTIISQANINIENSDLLFAKLIETRDAIPNEDKLPWRLQQLLLVMDENEVLGKTGLGLLKILPELTGANEPITLLIMAQNEDEVRPTGGFLSGAGAVTLENGELTGLSFIDGNQVDIPLLKPYDFPPQPYFDFMATEGFGYRDSNFWPDFPTSAKKTIELFTYGTEIPVDGAVAINQRFLQMLITVTGPIEIPELGVTVNSSNVIDSLRGAYGYQEGGEENIFDRKNFLGPFSSAILDKITNDTSSIDPVWLVRTVQEAAEQKHLQIYSKNPDVNETLAAIKWDGSINNILNEDTLMVVDTNMSFSKVNELISRKVSYAVDLNDNTASVKIIYTHSGSLNDPICDHRYTESVWDGINYGNLITGCYWNYLRVYAPTGSTFVSGSQHPVAASSLISETAWDGLTKLTDDPSGLTTYANMILVPESKTVEVTMVYQLPEMILQSNADGSQTYQLNLFKQSGYQTEPYDIKITLPNNSTYISSNHPLNNSSNNLLSFDLNLIKDQKFIINFK